MKDSMTHKSTSPLLTALRREFPVLSPSLVPRLEGDVADDETNGVEVVLRDAIVDIDFSLVLQSLHHLGQQGVIKNVFLYKDFLSKITDQQQTQLYNTLGQAFGNNIEELSLSFCKISLASLASILRQTPRLQRLYLGRVSLLRREHAAAFYTALTGLQDLVEFHCSLAPALQSTRPLFQSNNLEENAMDPFLHALAQLSSLEKVYLAAHRPRAGLIVEPTSLRALVENGGQVTDLTLMNCPLQAEHVRAIASSDKLTSLALMQTEMGDAGAHVIVDECLLTESSRLQKLYLPGNHLTDVGGMAIARALGSANNNNNSNNNNQLLTVLDLHDNRLTARFGQCMAASLQDQPSWRSSLKFLDVSYNPLLDAGGIAIACALTNNTRLEQLNLYNNQISDRTCAALATALTCNRHLKQLNLYNNSNISMKGVDSLIQKLEHENYVLQRLEVSFQNHHDVNNNSNNNDNRIISQQQQQKVSTVEQRRTKEAQLNFVLNLNRQFDRQTLFRNAATTDSQYLEKGLAQATTMNDLNSLYYFLKAKPTFCCNVAGEEEEEEKNEDGTDNVSPSRQQQMRTLSMMAAQAVDILDAHDDIMMF